jgi:tRNA pseudouridine55 synthase
MPDELHGVLVVDKPRGPSSFGVVQEVRRVLGVKRAGHGGTLDPMATGVLPVCLGEGTKLASFFLDADKEYEAEVLLGVATDTYDALGAVVETRDAGGVTERALRTSLRCFLGRIRQRPPAFSAIKQDGRPLYERARAGEAVEAPEREVEIHRLDVLALDLPRVRVHVVCSKGTYIRSLANDLGRDLGVGAHVTALRRTRTGAFGLDRAVPLAEIGAAAREARLPLLPLADAVGHLPRAAVTADLEARVRQGKPLTARDLGSPPPGAFVIVAAGGHLVAVAEAPSDPSRRVTIVRGFNYGG